MVNFKCNMVHLGDNLRYLGKTEHACPCSNMSFGAHKVLVVNIPRQFLEVNMPSILEKPRK